MSERGLWERAGQHAVTRTDAGNLACGDITMTCDVRAKVIECLKESKRQLTQRCRQKIFKLQEVEMVDPELDYQLMRVCKHMIRVRRRRDVRSRFFSFSLSLLASLVR